MKSFLLHNGKKPTCKWGLIPDNIFFEGTIPNGYNLAVVPGEGFIVVDVDKHGKLNGFDNIPHHLKNELHQTLNYATKNQGMHCWFKSTSAKKLMNKASGLGIDLRVNNQGYVVYYPNNDIRNQLHLIKETSKELNVWLEDLFLTGKMKKND